jgi:outer membrane lipoprotein-sorting protein
VIERALIFNKDGAYFMSMKKYFTSLSAVTVAALLTTAPAFAEIISLDRLNTYINNLPVVKTNFTQINSDGTKDKGQLYLFRPGKMRFEYAAPNNALVIAGAGSVAVYDDKSKSGPSVFPLKKTPLNLLLAKDVNLKSNGMVAKHVESGEYTMVVARDPKGQTKGQIQLVFSDNPVTLRQWIITNESRQKTTVILGKLREQKKFPLSLFEITRNSNDD